MGGDFSKIYIAKSYSSTGSIKLIMLKLFATDIENFFVIEEAKASCVVVFVCICV